MYSPMISSVVPPSRFRPQAVPEAPVQDAKAFISKGMISASASVGNKPATRRRTSPGVELAPCQGKSAFTPS